MKRFLLLIFLFMALGASQLRAQLIAVKTDALWDCAMVPNLGIELVTGERTSVGLSAFGSKNPWGKDISLVAVMPEFRYWFSGRPMNKHFVGLSALGTNYDIVWGKKILNGDAVGLGLTFGYSFFLSSHWSLECYGSFGAVYYKLDRGYTTDLYSNAMMQTHGYALVPFKLGVSFSYIIK